MSSWFGNGLSQITGQISNFTKEVLEEGTEEVDDVGTQLRITRSKFIELDKYCQAQRAEIERLTSYSDDLREKLESSELQINAVSNEYRGLVETKEKELQSLKLQQNEYYDSQSHLLESPSGASPPGTGMSHSTSMPLLKQSFQGDDHDFDDVISSQHEINRLRSENQKLEAEVRHWRQRSQANTTQTGSEDSGQIHQLETHIKELRQLYDDEIDQHQRELAALQDVHAQKLATIKRKNKDEISQLKEQLSEVQGQLSEYAGATSPKDVMVLKDKVEHLEAVNHKLTVDLDLTHAADREKARCLDDLKLQLQALTSDKNKVTSDYELLVQERKDLMDQLDAVVSERRRMSLQFTDMSSKMKEQSMALKEAKRPSSAPVSPRTSLVSSTPVAPGKQLTRPQRFDSIDLDDLHDESTISSNLDDLSFRNAELDEQVKILRGQVEAYENEINQFDLVRSDWDMEKEALEDVLLKLREELREREEKLTVIQAQKGLAACTKQQLSAAIRVTSEGSDDDRRALSQDLSSDIDIAELSHQVELLTQGNSDLEKERDSLLQKSVNLTKLVQEQKQRLNQFETKPKATVTTSAEKIAALQRELEEKQSNLSTLEAQLKLRNEHITNLAAQLESQKVTAAREHEHAMKSLQQKLIEVQSNSAKMSEIGSLLKRAEEEKLNLSQSLESRDSDMTALSTENNVLIEKFSTLSEEQKELGSKVEELRREKSSLREERNSLMESLDELDSQHEMALAQVLLTRNQLVKENGQLKLDISGLESKLQADEGQGHDMDNLQKELAKLKAEREKVAVSLNELHMANQEAAEAKAKLKEEKRVLSNKLHEVSKDRNNLKQSCQELTERVAEASGQVSSLQVDLNQLRQSNLHDHLAENQKLQQQVKSLEEQLQNSPAPNEESSDVLELEAEVEGLQAANKELLVKIAQLEEEKGSLEKELSHADEKSVEDKEQCKVEMESLTQLAVNGNDASNQDHIISNLRRDMQLINELAKEKESEITALLAENVRLKVKGGKKKKVPTATLR